MNSAAAPPHANSFAHYQLCISLPRHGKPILRNQLTASFSNSSKTLRRQIPSFDIHTERPGVVCLPSFSHAFCRSHSSLFAQRDNSSPFFASACAHSSQTTDSCFPLNFFLFKTLRTLRKNNRGVAWLTLSRSFTLFASLREPTSVFSCTSLFLAEKSPGCTLFQAPLFSRHSSLATRHFLVCYSSLSTSRK